MKNIKVIVIGFLCVALIAVSTLLWHQRAITADLQSKILAAAQNQTRLEAELLAHDKHARELGQLVSEGTARVHELEEKLAAAQQSIAKPKPDMVVSNTVQPSATAPAKDWLATAKDPEILQAQAARVRRQVESRYGNLAKKYGLTPQQSEQFMQLLVDKRLATTDATIASLAQNGNGPNDPAAIASATADSIDETNNQLRGLLGDANYADYRQQELTLGQSGTLVRLNDSLSGTEPLSSSQMDQLQQLLDQNNVGHLTVKIIAEASSSGFLSPVQLQALQELYQQQQAAQQQRRRSQPTPSTATP